MMLTCSQCTHLLSPSYPGGRRFKQRIGEAWERSKHTATMQELIDEATVDMPLPLLDDPDFKSNPNGTRADWVD